MSDTYNYPAEVERDEDGRHVVAFLKRAQREGGFIRPFWHATIEAPS